MSEEEIREITVDNPTLTRLLRYLDEKEWVELYNKENELGKKVVMRLARQQDIICGTSIAEMLKYAGKEDKE